MLTEEQIQEVRKMMRTRRPFEGFPLLCTVPSCEASEFETIELLRRHCKKTHPEFSVFCELCPAAYTTWDGLLFHLTDKHGLQMPMKRATVAECISDEEYIILKKKPCKIVTVEKFKAAGKEHFKVCGFNLFNDEMVEEVFPSGQKVQVPNYETKKYLLYGVDNGIIELYDDENGWIKDSVPLPQEPRLLNMITEAVDAGYAVRLPTDIELRAKVKAGGVGSALMVTVVQAMGREVVRDVSICPRKSFILMGVDEGSLMLIDSVSYDPHSTVKVPVDTRLKKLIEDAASGEKRVEVASFDGKEVVIGVWKVKVEG